MLVKVDIKRQKTAPSKVCKAFRWLLVALLAIRIILIVLAVMGIEIYFGGILPAYTTFIFDVIIIGTAIGAINFNNKRLYFLPAAVGVLVVTVYFTNLVSYSSNTFYNEFVSPDKTNTLVIREAGYLFSGETRFYKRVSPVFIKRLNEKIALDDDYQPIRKASLEVVWGDNSNTATLSYYDKENGALVYEKEISFDE